MPSINGITAFIQTHDGPLPEIGYEEFSGGISCYVPAQAGQQFWLHYTIHHPIPCNAVSVEFHVDGQRVDAHFRTAKGSSGNPTVGPVDSRITSQHIKERCADGSRHEWFGKSWRRDVFFTLVDQVKTKTPKALKNSEEALKYGTIECKVLRAESPSKRHEAQTFEFVPPPLEIYKGSLKGRHISHVSRLGARIEARHKKRYTGRSLDPDDSPFAWFKFHYRSVDYLQKKFKLPLLLDHSPTKSQMHRHLVKGFSEHYTADLCSPGSPIRMPETHSVSEPDSLEVTIHELEEELEIAREFGMEDPEQLACLDEQICRLRENSEKLRASRQVPRRALPSGSEYSPPDTEVYHYAV